MKDSNAVCRAILDSRDVSHQRITEVLLTELVALGDVDRNVVVALAKKLREVLNEQTDALVNSIVIDD